MNNIPTAKQFYDMHDSDDCVVMMKEFAKLHVEAALKAAAETQYPSSKANFELVNYKLLNAYPLENIK